MTGFDTAAELGRAQGIGDFPRRFALAWELSSGTRVDDPKLPGWAKSAWGSLRPERCYIEDDVRALYSAAPAITETS